MSDVFSVTASWNKASYNAGETMVGTIAGTNAHTTPATTTHQTAGPVTIPVWASPSGAPSTIILTGIDVVTTVPGTTTIEPVLIDLTRPIVDSGTPARTWVVSADRKSVSAVA